jgi:hypothetical protein
VAFDPPTDLDLVGRWDMHLPRASADGGGQELRQVHFALGAVTAWVAANAASGAQGRVHQRPTLADKELELPLLLGGAVEQGLP